MGLLSPKLTTGTRQAWQRRQGFYRFGVVQVGLSLKSHDPSQRANGFLTLAGGVIITFAKEILDLIMA